MAKKERDLKGKPFFIGIGYHLPHEPYVFPKWAWELYATEGTGGAEGTGGNGGTSGEPRREDPARMMNERVADAVATRPVGMPSYAMGDLQSPYDYYQPPRSYDNTTAESRLQAHDYGYGPQPINPAVSPEANRRDDVPISDTMRRELLRAYSACVTAMDYQLGRVLDRLTHHDLDDSTVVLFMADHGFNLGNHNLWGKRSLLESDARVPMIIADPRYPQVSGSGVRTALPPGEWFGSTYSATPR